jgi:hypothetical protein
MKQQLNLYEEDSERDELMDDRRRMGDAAVVDTGAGSRRPGALFRWLDRKEPARARRRFGRLYWDGASQFVMSVFLCLFGITFLAVGVLCMMHCTDFDRGVAFFCVGLLLIMPGVYGSATLFYYVRGYRGYSYKDLPTMN